MIFVPEKINMTLGSSFCCSAFGWRFLAVNASQKQHYNDELEGAGYVKIKTSLGNE